MHVAFALFADAANLSQEGKLNILGVFDAVQVATMPTVHPRATLVLRLKGTNEGVAFDRRVWFSDTYVRTPDGWKYFFGQASLRLPDEAPKP